MLYFHRLTIITGIKAPLRSWTVVVSLGPQSAMLSQGKTPDILNFTVLPSCLAELIMSTKHILPPIFPMLGSAWTQFTASWWEMCKPHSYDHKKWSFQWEVVFFCVLIFFQLNKPWEFVLILSTNPHNITHNSRPRLAHHQVHYSFLHHTVLAPIPPTVPKDNAEPRLKLHKNSTLQPGLGQFSVASNKHYYLLSLFLCVSLLLYYTQRAHCCVECN